MKNIINLGFIVILAFSFQSCKEYREFENLEVIEDTYDGPFLIDETNADLDMDFSSDGTDGAYCFIWTNPSRSSVCSVTLSGVGSLRFEIDDARGNVVADETINLSETTTLSFQTDKGPKGNWFVKMFFTGFEGEGECDLGPA